MIVPEWIGAFRRFSEKILILDAEVNECISAIVKSLSSFDCNGQFFVLINGKGIRFGLFVKLILVIGPFQKGTDGQSHSHPILYSSYQSFVLRVNWAFSPDHTGNILGCCDY
jgi:hypothetical protein